MKKYYLLPLLLLSLILLPTESWAASSVIGDITGQFGNNMANWTGPLQQYASRIFWLLVIIDFTWTAGKLAIVDWKI